MKLCLLDLGYWRYKRCLWWKSDKKDYHNAVMLMLCFRFTFLHWCMQIFRWFFWCIFFTFKERKDSRTFLIIGLIQLLVEADDCFLTKLSLLVFYLMIHYCQELLNNFLCIHSHENSIRFFNILWYRRIQCLQFQMQMLAQSSTFKPFFSQNYLNGSQLFP